MTRTTLQRRLHLATVITTTTIVVLSSGTSVQATSAAGSNRRFSGRLHPHGDPKQYLDDSKYDTHQQRTLGLWGVTAPPLSTATYMTTIILERLRGGDDATSTHIDSDDEEDEDETERVPDALVPATNTNTNEKSPDDDNKNDVDKDDDDDDHDDNPLASVMSMQPLTVTIQTALMGRKHVAGSNSNSILDQSIELTVNRSRNVASLKQSLSRQLLGRPPVSAIRITAPGKGILADDVLVDELVDDEDDEEEEDDEEGGPRGLVLQLDMVPPVDPKFIPQLEVKMEEMTTSELLDAYTANEAAVHCNAALVMQDENDNDDDENDNESLAGGTLVCLQLQQQAARMRRDLEAQLLSSPTAQELLQDEMAPHTKAQAGAGSSLAEIQVRGQRIRKHHPGLAGRGGGGGVKTSMRLSMQRNLNINWNDSIRYFCVFVFFGLFGGRTPSSKAILLLGAPAVFVLQARPVKLWMKQLLYAFFDQPPGIFLSLLPAPQQAILSLRVGDAMQVVYGPYAGGPGSSHDNDENDDMNQVDLDDDDEMDDFGVEDDVDVLDYDDDEEDEDYQDDDYDFDEDEDE